MRIAFRIEKNKFVPAGLVLVLCLFSGLCGCVKLERPALDRKYFTLDVKREAAPAAVKCRRNLVVRRVNISPRYEDRDLVYKIGPNSFEADYYNSFFIPPAGLLTQDLRVWMADADIFANVLGPESLGTGEFLLEGVVNSIYGDYSVTPHKAVLNMQFFLLNNGRPDVPIVYSRNFSLEVPINGTGPEALVQSMNKGIKEIFTNLESDLQKVVDR